MRRVVTEALALLRIELRATRALAWTGTGLLLALMAGMYLVFGVPTAQPGTRAMTVLFGSVVAALPVIAISLEGGAVSTADDLVRRSPSARRVALAAKLASLCVRLVLVGAFAAGTDWLLGAFSWKAPMNTPLDVIFGNPQGRLGLWVGASVLAFGLTAIASALTRRSLVGLLAGACCIALAGLPLPEGRVGPAGLVVALVEGCGTPAGPFGALLGAAIVFGRRGPWLRSGIARAVLFLCAAGLTLGTGTLAMAAVIRSRPTISPESPGVQVAQWSLAPDGGTLAFILCATDRATRSLWLLDIESLELRPTRGVELARMQDLGRAYDHAYVEGWASGGAEVQIMAQSSRGAPALRLRFDRQGEFTGIVDERSRVSRDPLQRHPAFRIEAVPGTDGPGFPPRGLAVSPGGRYLIAKGENLDPCRLITTVSGDAYLLPRTGRMGWTKRSAPLVLGPRHAREPWLLVEANGAVQELDFSFGLVELVDLDGTRWFGFSSQMCMTLFDEDGNVLWSLR